MTRGMYRNSVNVILTAETKLNNFKELEDHIEPTKNKGTKMNKTNKLGTKMIIKLAFNY